MMRLPGKQAGTVRYFHDGYTYYQDKRNTATIFRCAFRARLTLLPCTASVYVDVESLHDLENAVVQTNGVHNHPPEENKLLIEQFIEEVLVLSSTTFDGLKLIYDRVLAKEEYLPIRGLDEIRFYTKIKLKMKVARRNNVPNTPRDLAELAEMLEEYSPMENIYRGCTVGADGSIALIFLHDGIIDGLSHCTQLYADGTFKIRPMQPACAQVFIIHFRKMTVGFPAIFVIASSKTAHMYDAIWSKIKEIIPELATNVFSITSDFEQALIKSSKENFPTARIAGCLFHFKQALVKRWSKLNIQPDYEYILEKAYAIAHLPENKIEEGVTHVTRLIDNCNAPGEPANQLQQFGSYLRRFWLPLKAVLSVFRKPIRTNNTCENFHLHAARTMGSRSGIWKMLDEMKKIMEKTNAFFIRVQNGRKITANRPFELQRADSHIYWCENNLERGKLTVEEFLTSVGDLRRLYLTRLYEVNEELRRPIVEVQPENEMEMVRFFEQNLDADAGPGGQFENEMLVRRGRRRFVVRDIEQLPYQNPEVEERAVDEAAAAPRRRGRPRNQIDVPNADQPPVVRRRGRPRLNPPRAREEEAVVQAANPERPIARQRGRPRRNPYPLPPRERGEAEIEIIDGNEELVVPPALDAEEVPVLAALEAEELPVLAALQAEEGPIPAALQAEDAPIPDALEAEEPLISVALAEEPLPPTALEVREGQIVEDAIIDYPIAAPVEAATEAPMEVVELPNENEVEEARGEIGPAQTPNRVRRRRGKRGCNNRLCIVCYESKKVQKLKPCNHRMCTECIAQLVEFICPICRRPIESYLPFHVMFEMRDVRYIQ